MNLATTMLEQMDSQDVFDVAAWHMLTQSRRGCDDEGNCMYRAPGGMRCAVGWLIPDSLYDAEMEHRYVGDLMWTVQVSYDGYRFARFIVVHRQMLEALQMIHDRREPWTWPGELFTLALRFGLNPRVVSRWPLPVASPVPIQRQATEPSEPDHQPPPALVKMLARLPTFQISYLGVDHGCEKREEAPEVCGA